MLIKDERQLCYYDGGVGTLVDPMSLTHLRKLLRRNLDAASGHSYRLFLFGFSRGAYTVRDADDRSRPDPYGPMHDELHKKGRKLLKLTLRRAWDDKRHRLVWRRPHFGTRRQIPEGSSIHRSVIVRRDRAALNYHPRFPASYDIID
jgi:hypothetical protein